MFNVITQKDACMFWDGKKKKKKKKNRLESFFLPRASDFTILNPPRLPKTQMNLMNDKKNLTKLMHLEKEQKYYQKSI
jgi:hypothetical protein